MSGENTISIVGWGNQARAWAQNLRDSGYSVNILLRPGSSSWQAAQSVGTVYDLKGPLPTAPVALLIPDHEIAAAVGELSQRLIDGTTLLYAHGYALLEERLDEKFPQHHHVLLAPKAIGTEVRATYLEKRPLGGVYSVERVREAARPRVTAHTLAIAQALGITMGPYACTVAQETVADLFSEQAVLCSIIPESCRLAFDMLRARGIPPELAFFELWHEVGLIVKVMVDKGPEAFFNLISPNALIGSEKGRQLLCDDHFKSGLEKLLVDIENGTFQKEVAQSSVTALRSEIISRWKNSELGETAKRLQKGHS